MARRDIYHDTVKRALQKDGWTITHDPFPLQIGKKRLSADLGAERLISAEKGIQKIVVEVKSFVGQSDVKIWSKLWGSMSSIAKSLTRWV
jgi:hypothetical protein